MRCERRAWDRMFGRKLIRDPTVECVAVCALCSAPSGLVRAREVIPTRTNPAQTHSLSSYELLKYDHARPYSYLYWYKYKYS